MMDLGKLYDVYAIQLNFAEHNTDIYGRNEGLHHRYQLEASVDKIHWVMLSDKSLNEDDHTHNYFALDQKMAFRYIRVTNIEVPGGHFAVSGFRVFGTGNDHIPGKIKDLIVVRDEIDRRKVSLNWSGSNATGYHILFGTQKDRLYNCYTVYEANNLNLNSLNAEKSYYFSLEAFNESGIREMRRAVFVK